jgi:hypothetical protein
MNGMGGKYQINLTFSKGEEKLYEWILSKAEKREKYRRGVSEFIKELLWSEYMAERREPLTQWWMVVKELISGARCVWCGSKPTVKEVNEKCVVLYCKRCQVSFSENIQIPRVKLPEIGEHTRLDLDT